MAAIGSLAINLTMMSNWTNVTNSGDKLKSSEREICDYIESIRPMRITIDIFVVSFLCIAGLIGNTIAILVLRTDNINKMVSFLLQAVAVADNAYLVACLFMQPLKTLCDSTNWIPNWNFIFPYIEPYVFPFASIAQMTGVWYIVLVTTDRFMAICYPFEKFRAFITRHTRKAVFIIPIVVVIYNIPRFFEQYTRVDLERCHNISRAFSVHTDMRKNKNYILVYKTCMALIFRFGVPLSILMVLNIRLICTLRGARKDRVKLTLSHNPNKKDSFTTILVSVVTVFIICQLPDFILRILITVRYYFGVSLPFKTSTVVHFVNAMLTLNASVNCLIYCMTGRRFRRILKHMLCRSFSQYSERPSFLDEGCGSEAASTLRKNNKATVLVSFDTTAFFNGTNKESTM